LMTGAVAAVALIAGLMLGRRQSDSNGSMRQGTIHASFALGDSAAVRAVGNIRLAISPSGQRIVYVGADGAGTALWVREFDQPAPRRLPDTKGAFAPFFSPDGESIGFFISTSSGGATVLKVVPLSGGVARTVVQDSVARFGGADWGDDGQIYFTHANRGLARVASSGGAVTKVSHPDTARSALEHDYPYVLPGSRRALVSMWSGSAGSNHIGVVDLRTGDVTNLAAGTYARYTLGHLVLGTGDGQILVAAFDARSGRLGGPPVLMLQDVETEPNSGTVQFAVSESGTIVFQQKAGGSPALVWVDRSGHQAPVDSTLTNVSSFALSPNGNEIAVARTVSGNNQVWVKNLATGSLSRLSFDMANADRPTWTPDGRRVAFLGVRDGRRMAWVRRADGSDNAQPASPGETRLDEIAYDPLGRYTLLRTEGAGAGSRHLLVVKNGVDTVPRTLVQSRFDNFAMTVSPNGQWLAYASNESGTNEVYVRPFPNVDSARFVISAGGGASPVWRRDGTELFFRSSRGDMFAVPVTTTHGFVTGTPKLLFSASALAEEENYRRYDVHPDGQRFLMATPGAMDATHLNVIFNWGAGLAGAKGSPK
jgi:Tol biopolymer transport system component